MEFRTKQEAQEAAKEFEQGASSAEGRARVTDRHGHAYESGRAATYRAEAARIRALLPTLPE